MPFVHDARHPGVCGGICSIASQKLATQPAGLSAQGNSENKLASGGRAAHQFAPGSFPAASRTQSDSSDGSGGRRLGEVPGSASF